MTREEEIKSVIDTIFGEKGRTSEQVAAANGFKAGVNWADKHPINIWHDASEEPKEGKFILCVDDDNDFHTGVYYVDRVGALNRVFESAVWNYGELICYWDDIKEWAYIDALLPKGGEK